MADAVSVTVTVLSYAQRVLCVLVLCQQEHSVFLTAALKCQHIFDAQPFFNAPSPNPDNANALTLYMTPSPCLVGCMAIYHKPKDHPTAMPSNKAGHCPTPSSQRHAAR